MTGTKRKSGPRKLKGSGPAKSEAELEKAQVESESSRSKGKGQGRQKKLKSSDAVDVTSTATKKSAKKAAPKKSKQATSEADELNELVKSTEHLSFVETEFGRKVKCSILHHELPAKLDAVKAYLDSKKLFKAKNEWYSDSWVEKYQPYIIAHKKNPKKLYCKLTKRAINKIPEEVEKHVNGRKFLRLKQEKEERVAKGVQSDEEDSEEEDGEEGEEEEEEEGEGDGESESMSEDEA